MQGQDNYWPMVQQAYSLLVHWKQDLKNIIRLIGGVNDSLAFMNVGTEAVGHTSGNGSGQQWWCFNCNRFGHIAQACPDPLSCTDVNVTGNDTTAMQLVLQGMEDLVTDDSYQFAQHDGHLPVSWILLDTRSTVNVF